jgi:nucleoside-diphosphate-sugar epimerase
MKILVVGSSGFLGSKIASCLKSLGHEIVETSRSYENGKVQIKAGEPLYINELGIDLLINASGYYRKDNLYLRTTLDSNLGICNSIARSVENVGLGVINLGSYFELAHESHAVNSMSYTVSKRLGTSILESYSSLYGKRFTQVILYDNYDTDLSRGKILDKLITSAISGEEIEISNIKSKVNLLHVSAIINGVIKIVQSYQTLDVIEQRVDLMSAEPITIEDIIFKIESSLEKEIRYRDNGRELDLNLQSLLVGNSYMLKDLVSEFELDDFLGSINKLKFVVVQRK